MNRSYRLLSIYSRLMNRQYINKQQLAFDMDVDKRTIQRDIDDIRNFLYDSDEFGGQRIDVNYNHKNDSYQLSTFPKHRNSNPLKLLLILIRSHTRVLTPDLHDFLISLIHETYEMDRDILLIMMNDFNIQEAGTSLENINKILNTLYKQNYSLLNENKEILYPLKLHQEHSQYFLTYIYSNQQLLEDVNTLGISLDDKKDGSIKDNEPITLEMEKNLWERLHQEYKMVSLESINDTSLIGSFNMTHHEAIKLCLIHSPDIRLIGPALVQQQFQKN